MNPLGRSPTDSQKQHPEESPRQLSREHQGRLGKAGLGLEEPRNRIFRKLHPFHKGKGWSKNQ